MLVAEIILTQYPTSFGSGASTLHTIGFEDLEEAWAKYNQISELLTQKNARANDVPDTLKLAGPFNEVTMPFNELHSIAIADFAKMNSAKSGLREAYPNLRQ